MVQTVPLRPLPLLILHLDQGEKDYAGKTIDFRGISFVKRVLDFGVVERSIPYPTGLISIPDATVTVADTDREIRGFLDARTPLRRLAEIAFEYESNATYPTVGPDIDYPVGDPQTYPIFEPVYNPFFTGEIVGVDYGPGTVTLRLKDITSSWLERKIPNLGIRDNFPNMPDDVESIFIPFIFGRCFSLTGTGLDVEGVIRCHHIDTTTNRYVVARTTCFSVPAVYRKRPLDGRFKLVDVSEYTIVTEAKIINGISYNFTYIQFIAAQKDGTIINADVSGLETRYDFATETWINGEEVRDFVDSAVSLIYISLLDEANLQRFDSFSFQQTRERTQAKFYKCDGAITEQATIGLAISRLLGDAVIDFYQTNRGLIKIHLFDAELDLDSIIPLDDDDILNQSLHPHTPTDKIYNRIRYRYTKQNAGLSVFRANTKSGTWMTEYTVDNLPDQAELAAAGANPILELEVEMPFVRDNGTAKKVIKQRLTYHTLRSYTTELDLAGPEIINYLGISDTVAITQVWGVAPSAGWVDALMRVYRIVFDIRALVATLSSVIPAFISDANLEWSVDAFHEEHDPYVRNPQLATYVNGTLDPGNPARVFPDADVSIDLQDSFSEVVTSEIIYPAEPDIVVTNFGAGPSESQPASQTSDNDQDVAWVGIKWVEDQSVNPRGVQGFVPIPKTLINNFVIPGEGEFVLYSGTLDPDEKPGGLTDADANKVLFYSQDFDRLYIWIGTGDPLGYAPPWTNTGWYGIDSDQGSIIYRFFAPITPGWGLVDGTAYNMSQPDGTVDEQETPDLTDNRFLKGTATYEDPTDPNSDPVAPTITGTIGGLVAASSGAHTHTAFVEQEYFYGQVAHHHVIDHTHGGSTGNASAGTPSGTVASDGAHTHGVSGTIGPDGTHGHDLSTSSSGSHAHTGSANSDGNHTHAAGTLEIPSHTHGIVSESGHTHNFGGASGSVYTTGSTGTPTGTVQVSFYGAFLYPAYPADGSHTHPTYGYGTASNVSGTTDSGGGHDHTGETGGIESGGTLVSGSTASDGAHTHTLTVDSSGSHTHNVIQDAGNDGVHSHDVSLTSASGGAHTHTFTGSAMGNHAHSIPAHVGDSGPADWVLPEEDITVTVISDGAHTHTITGSVDDISADTDGRPKSVGLMPYMRL